MRPSCSMKSYPRTFHNDVSILELFCALFDLMNYMTFEVNFDLDVLLLDPMLATGGSAMMAIEVLLSKGVPAERILFLNLIASPEGLVTMNEKYPKVKVICGFVDKNLNEKR